MKELTNFLNKIIIFFLFTIINFCIATEPFYLITQGKEQIKILLKRKKLNEPEVYNKYFKQIETIDKIKKFSKDVLKLNINEHYNTIVEVQGNVVSYIVVGCEKLSFNAISYWFPIVGTVYYLGFFDLNDAKEYAEYLKNKNYDVRITGVQAYSTLGWFADPLFSYHLNYTEEELARMIFHELTHNTYWKKNQNQWNENLAIFIEEEGVIQYLKLYYNEEKIKNFKHKLEEEQKLDLLLYSYKLKLNDLYINKHLNLEEKISLKQKIILDLQQELKTLKNKFKYINIEHLTKKEFNNADFVLMNLYRDNNIQQTLKEYLENCKYDFDCFWMVLKFKSK